jgi:hypothetical protein
VETYWKEILEENGDPSTSLHSAQDDSSPKPIYNAFIMPCCAENVKEKFPNAVFFESGLFSMCRVGYIYGDWKDRSKHYHKIHCILLDMKSVMRNYANNPAAQSELAGLIAL